MQAVGLARHGVLAPYLRPGHTAIGSINSPMQCMMKEVCAQCLQPQVDPETGERTVVFSCFNQDQALDRVDFPRAPRAVGTERIAGKAVRAMDRPRAAPARCAAEARGGVIGASALHPWRTHDTTPDMNVALRKPWTQQQFFQWAETQAGRYEFDGIQPVAMTGGNVGHGLIMRNLHRALDTRLRGGGCRPLGPDVGIETINRAVRYPDALVTRSTLDPTARTAPDPVVVFEILSPTSGRVDRIIKVREYAAVASIRRYIILELSSVGLTVMERSTPEEVWRVITLTNDDNSSHPGS